MTEAEIRQHLLPDLRNDRQITWEDAGRDARLVRYAADGIAYIDSLLPAPADYRAQGNARRLLFAYVMYAEAQAADDFRENYAADLLQLKMDAERDAYAEIDDSAL